MLNGAWEGGKKKQTNPRQTEREVSAHASAACYPCVLQADMALIFFFFWCLLFGQMLVENRVEAGVGSVCLCGRQMFFLSEKNDKKNTQQMKIERSPTRDPAVLYSACTGTHTHTRTHRCTHRQNTHKQTQTHPLGQYTLLTLPSALCCALTCILP